MPGRADAPGRGAARRPVRPSPGAGRDGTRLLRPIAERPPVTDAMLRDPDSEATG